MLWLIDVDPDLRFEAFDRECFLRRLAPTTAETYWTAWLSVAKMLGVPARPDDKKVAQRLASRSASYPIHFPEPMTKKHLDALRARFSKTLAGPVAMIAACWTLGQRISDFMQIATANVSVTVHGRLSILINKGKLVSKGSIPPYHLFLDWDHTAAQELLAVHENAQREERLFLASPSNSPEEREALARIVRDLLHRIDAKLELRSIRRGGLQHMASQEDTTLQEVLDHSRHTDVDMLNRYLDWGRHARQTEEAMARTTRKML